LEQHLLRKFIAVLILAPLAIILIAFAVANRQPVSLSFDPLSPGAPAAALTLPLFVVVLAALITGVIVGGFAVRLGHGRWRRVARRLERETGELRARLDALVDKTAEPSIVPRQQEAPPRLRLKPPAQ
jgi:uncharacterized integral membrane protein